MYYVLTNLLWLLPMESTMGQGAKAEGFFCFVFVLGSYTINS